MATSQPDLTECNCGRLASKPHCPACGSAQVLASARKRDYVTRPDGKTVELKVYRCRVCANNFNDDNRVMCSAPPPRMTYKTTAVPQQQARSLTTRDAGTKAIQLNEFIATNKSEEYMAKMRKKLGLE
jgi:transposase-like protein